MAEPETNSIFDIPSDDAEETAGNALADVEIDAGLGVPHDKRAVSGLQSLVGERRFHRLVVKIRGKSPLTLTTSL
jgi:hypothetical protein